MGAEIIEEAGEMKPDEFFFASRRRRWKSMAMFGQSSGGSERTCLTDGRSLVAYRS